MAYASGDTITADQFNEFVSSTSDPFGYNHFAGTGSGVYGLGQTEIQTVTGGATTITAAQFNALFTGMINIGNHSTNNIKDYITTISNIKLRGVEVYFRVSTSIE